MKYDEVVEVSIPCDSEAAEAVSELFNRLNGGGYDADSETGQATGGGAIIEITGLDDFGQPIEGKYRAVVKTYIKPDVHGKEVRRQIEEGLWHLRQIYPMPVPEVRVVKEEDWAHAWKKHYKPLRVGHHIVLKPSWEEFDAAPDDVVIELDPGMAFGTGLHPSTRLCIAALERVVQPGDSVLDVGTGSGVLSIVAAKLGATTVVATDIDPIAVEVAKENMVINRIGQGGEGPSVTVSAGSIPEDNIGGFSVVVANILAEVLVNLLDGAYDNVPLAEPVAPGGLMIMAGIIEERAPMVLEACARYGLTLQERLQEEDWIALVLRKGQTTS